MRWMINKIGFRALGPSTEKLPAACGTCEFTECTAMTQRKKTSDKSRQRAKREGPGRHGYGRIGNNHRWKGCRRHRWGTAPRSNLREKQIPHVCYHSPLMGPIRSCDTCLVEVNGKLERACGTEVSPGLRVVTSSDRATSARSEAFDVILTNHMLYCTVCDNRSGPKQSWRIGDHRYER